MAVFAVFFIGGLFALGREDDKFQAYVAKTLAEGVDRHTIIAALVEKGWPDGDAGQLVDKTQLALNDEVNAERAGSYIMHILLGALWAGGGAAITLATYSAAEPGGPFIIAWGAIGIGALEFLYGLVGWVRQALGRAT